MRVPPLVLLAGLLALSGIAVTVRRQDSDPYAPERLRQLLERPLTRPAKDGTPATPFWRALLAHPRVRHDAQGFELALGRVQADPTRARAAALAAGELLALPALDPDGRPAPNLFEVLLASPAAQPKDGGTSLALYGCRHSASPEAAPALEDSYHARLSLAEALERLAREAGRALTLEGVETPVKGGANFELTYVNGRQRLELTFEGAPERRWTVEREFATEAPADARARAAVVTALRTLVASDASLGTLTLRGETEPVADGLDLRLEQLGGRLSILTASSQGPRLTSFLELAPTPSSD